MAPDPVDPAAVEAAITEIQRVADARLAEARASLEALQRRMGEDLMEKWDRAKLEAERDEAVARAEKAERERDEWRDDASHSRQMWKSRCGRAEADLSACREALEKIVRSWTDPPPAARMDVRYQEAVRTAREALSRLDYSSEEKR